MHNVVFIYVLNTYNTIQYIPFVRKYKKKVLLYQRMTMERNSDARSSLKSLRSMLALHREPLENETEFCKIDNIDGALSTLSEEFESLGILNSSLNYDRSPSVESLKSLFARLVNASWNLAIKHRILIRANDEDGEIRQRIANDNCSLVNHVKRLKDDIDKKQHLLYESQERERRLKVKCESLTRDLKREKDEAVKLRKQLQSKDLQHSHEVKRLQQSCHKLRDQLQKSVGMYVPRDKASQNVQAENERQLNIYKQTICRLEENNRQLILDNNDLRETLSLHADAIDLQAEASGIWNDTDCT